MDEIAVDCTALEVLNVFRKATAMTTLSFKSGIFPVNTWTLGSMNITAATPKEFQTELNNYLALIAASNLI